MNYENLQKLYEKLDEINEYEFDMLVVRSGDIDFFQKSRKCNSSGCMLGHTPEIVSDELLSTCQRPKDKTINFAKLGELAYGIDFGSYEFDYLFSEQWGFHPKTATREHAKRRIQRIIEGYEPMFILDEVREEIKYVEENNFPTKCSYSTIKK